MSKETIQQLEEALERVEIELNALKVLREQINQAQQTLDAVAKEFLSEEGYETYANGKSQDSK